MYGKIGTKLTSSSKKHKNPHIFEAKNIDDLLQTLSKDLFKITSTSRTILALLGRKGSQIESQLSNNTLRNRTSIGRNINKSKGLLELGFIYESSDKKHKRKRPFTLTFKGFLGSLAKTKVEENFLIKLYLKKIEKKSDQKFAEFVLNYIKYNLAVVLYWHKLNGFILTDLNNVMSYLSNFNYRQLYDAFPIELTYVKDQKQINEFIIIRQFFLSLQIAMAKLLQNKEKKFLLDPYEILGCNNKLQLYYSEEFLYSFIKGWMHCLDFPEYFDPKIPLRKVDHIIPVVNIDRANNLASEFLNSMFNIKKTEKDQITII
jgi:hypothetical protein